MKKILSCIIAILLIFSNFTIYSSAIASKWDSRDYGIITSIKKQNKGICWAYSLCAAAEADVLQQGITNDIDFSEEYLYSLHCLHRTDIEAETETGDTPLLVYDIGYYYNVLAYESDYPQLETGFYSTEQLKSNQCPYYIDKIGVVKEDKIKDWIIEHGAVIACLHADDVRDTYIYNNDELVQDHSLTIIGWDDNFPAYNFKDRPSSNGAWLCKNSWGTQAGDNGYFWVSYEDKTLIQFVGLTVSTGYSENFICNVPINNDNETGNITIENGNSDKFGIGTMFEIKKDTIIDRFQTVIHGTCSYEYEIYFIDNPHPTIYDFAGHKPVKTGTISSVNTKDCFVNTSVNLLTHADGYLFILILTDSDKKLSLNFLETDKIHKTYQVQKFENDIGYCKLEDAHELNLSIASHKNDNTSSTTSIAPTSAITTKQVTTQDTSSDATQKTLNTVESTTIYENSIKSLNPVNILAIRVTFILCVIAFIAFVLGSKKH